MYDNEYVLDDDLFFIEDTEEEFEDVCLLQSESCSDR